MNTNEYSWMCKGSYAVGTACGKCPKCADERRRLGIPDDGHGEYIAAVRDRIAASFDDERKREAIAKLARLTQIAADAIVKDLQRQERADGAPELQYGKDADKDGLLVVWGSVDVSSLGAAVVLAIVNGIDQVRG